MLVCILCVLLLFISSLLTLAFAFFLFFFFNDTATTEIYTLSLHDALPISPRGAGWCGAGRGVRGVGCRDARRTVARRPGPAPRPDPPPGDRGRGAPRATATVQGPRRRCRRSGARDRPAGRALRNGGGPAPRRIPEGRLRSPPCGRRPDRRHGAHILRQPRHRLAPAWAPRPAPDHLPPRELVAALLGRQRVGGGGQERR